MAVLPMKRIQLCALSKDRKSLLDLLQRRGVVELCDAPEEDSVFRKVDMSAQRMVFEKCISVATQALDVLEHNVPEKKPLLAMLEGRKELSPDLYEIYNAEQEEIMRVAHRLVALSKAVAEHSAEIPKLEAGIEALTPWMALDVPQDFKGTKSTAAIIGAFPAEISQQDIYDRLASLAPMANAVNIDIISISKDQTCIFALCARSEAQAVEDALRTLGFARPASPSPVPPVQHKDELLRQIDEANAAIEAAKTEITSYVGERNALRFIIDYYSMRAEKYEVLGGLLQTRRTFLITGYVPEPACVELERVLTARFDCAFEAEDPGEDENAPVVLRNNGFTDPMENVVAGYSLPGKGEIDPSPIMAVFYYIFFGMMFSDAAYGFILAAACGIILWKCKNMEPGMRRNIKLFFYCGLSTIFWGVMFGSYFGDALSVITGTFFGKTITIPPLWMDPVSNPMKLLLLAFAFGVVHVFTGLAVLLYQNLRSRQYKDALYDAVFWYLLVGGGIIVLVASPIFGEMFSLSLNLPGIVSTIATVCALVGAVGILFTGGRESRNPVKRLLKGAYALYNVTGYLSDILSYSRLLALGLATSVIATVFNQMGSMVGGSVVGAIVFILVFLIGHVLNIGINVLGAYVHTNRLQYVEFFGKFYQGGGKPFEPFSMHTKYYKIKEEL